MERWLSRLWLSFAIIAAVLAWNAYKASTGRMGPVSNERVLLYAIGAAASFSVAMLGVRVRHKNNRF